MEEGLVTQAATYFEPVFCAVTQRGQNYINQVMQSMSENRGTVMNG